MINQKAFLIIENKITMDKNDTLYLNDIAEVYSPDIKIRESLDNIVIYKSKNEENWDYITQNNVIEKVLNQLPDIDLDLYGATEVIIEIKSQEKEKLYWIILKIVFVSAILFFGAAMGIIYFHEDVNMTETLAKIYFTFTGEKKENPLIMTIPYSLGLGIGMTTFFKRILSKSLRRRKEPGPLDLELLLYDNDMEDFILNQMKKGGRNDK